MIYKAAHIFTMAGEPIEGGSVLIRDDRICDIGTDLIQKYSDEPVDDLGNCVLMPGFVNAHSHIDYTWSRNQYDALNLWDWISRVGYRSGHQPDYDSALDSAILGAAECVRSGITCLGDSTLTGSAAEAMSKLGLRGIAYRELFGQSMGSDYPNQFQQKLDEVRELQERSSKLVKIGLSPHTVYTTNVEVLELCADSGLPVAIHLAETWAEAEYTQKGAGPIAAWRNRMGRPPMTCGLTPARILEKTGLLKKGTSLAHCVHLSDDEIELIAQSEASVAHCPRSNAYLGCGIAPITKLLAEGAVVGLGTDSEGSCMRFDFFEEMRFALGMARASRQDAEVITANDILRMATIVGAETLGLEKDVGTLEIGKRADILAIDMNDVLADENLSLAVLSRSQADVVMVMVDGVEIVKDRKLVVELSR
jgi:cytosine/adenosine deaminase-related metal-dependent hydrolase